MPREHANIRTDIWNDEEFRQLTPHAQLLYLQLLSSATLTYAGVADWRPKRIAALADGWRPRDVEAAGEELVAGLYIVIDEDTEEVLVRSFLKHDGLLQKPNVSKAMARDFGKVYSATLKGVIVHELKRLAERFPDWRGFAVGEVKEVLSKGSVNPSELLARNPSPNPSGNGSEKSGPLLTTSTATSTGHTLHASIDALFERAYEAWPKKAERKRSFEKFQQLAKKHDPEWLAGEIVRFGAAYAMATEKRFVPALVVWLNGERWTDELPTPDKAATDAAWADALSSVDPCAVEHKWTVDGTCARCVARKETA